MAAARERIHAGGLGRVFDVHGGYIQDWLLEDTDWNWRLDPVEGGELRAVADIGSHWLDLVGFVTGKRIAQVFGDFATVHEVRRVPTGPVETFSGGGDDVERVEREMSSEDLAHILLRFEDGARGSLVVSQMSAGRKNRVWFEADGTGGALAWDAEVHEQLWLGHRDGPNELLHRREPGRERDYPSGHAEGFPDTFKQLYRAVYRAVEAGGMPAEPDFPIFRDGHEGSCSARRSRPARATAAGWTSAVRPWRVRPDEARLPDRPVPGDAADGGRRLGGRRGLRGPRYRLLAAVDGAERGATPARAHIDVANLSGGPGDGDPVDEIELEGPGRSQGLGFYPNPLHAGSRAPGHSVIGAPEAGDRGAPRRWASRYAEHVHGRRRGEEPGPELEEALREWPDIVKFAQDHGRKITIENCPMLFTQDEWPGGKNLATTPAIWRRMFDDIPSANFGLNFDPSHLIWQQMIDMQRFLKEFGPHVLHYQEDG